VTVSRSSSAFGGLTGAATISIGVEIGRAVDRVPRRAVAERMSGQRIGIPTLALEHQEDGNPPVVTAEMDIQSAVPVRPVGSLVAAATHVVEHQIGSVALQVDDARRQLRQPVGTRMVERIAALVQQRVRMLGRANVDGDPMPGAVDIEQDFQMRAFVVVLGEIHGAAHHQPVILQAHHLLPHIRKAARPSAQWSGSVVWAPYVVTRPQTPEWGAVDGKQATAYGGVGKAALGAIDSA
jgi:hypothetical protein